ncbi:Xylose operon regulatory protein [Polystyrenella longa]|uniref:Xylose operon regulatory protein n=1 Tax=Polystyrenella longa TaxID=2528007 RepID=A0A518CP37_9PLAN|nr:XylR family transcriptional regulator [Polystyrenella longa]QDU80964.1 Xylose operon regulatory protein [Polystyrenella longa]
MTSRRSVALLLETSNAYARGLLDGIIDYLREHEQWSIHLGEQERGAKPPHWLKNWRGDGIIARIETEAIANAVRQTGLPIVDVSAARLVPSLPWVETDDREIARMALEHFLSRGFHSVAFCGENYFNWSRWRAEAFEEFANEAECQFESFDSGSRRRLNMGNTRQRTRLAKWILSLPRPTGIFACYDFMGQQILDVCRELEISVPEQIAVLGVDNDQRLCRLCSPPLSSIIPDTRATGYAAAQLLDELMTSSRTRKSQPAQILIPPQGIAERQSSDMYASDDVDLVAALRFIREHACEGITVNDVLRQVPLSRRALEARCQKLTGRTPHAEITRIKLERSKRLLRQTGLTVHEVAQRSGFSQAEYLSVVFKKQTGQTPGEFRSSGLAGS